MQAERLHSYLLVWDERLIIKTFHFLDVLFVQTDELWTKFEIFWIYVLRLILPIVRFYENDRKMITLFSK